MEAAKARTGGGPARVVTSMLTRNLGAKGLALVCAIVLWLYMREQVQPDHDEYFELMITKAWNLNNKNYSRGWAGEI